MLSRSEKSSVINYSQRFTLEHMTGSFSELVQQGLFSLTNGTQGHDELKKRQAAGAVGAIGAAGAGAAAPAVAAAPAAAAPEAETDAGMYTVPYPLQVTGLTKYAPMPKHPGTTITAKSLPPQFPASTYVVATTILPIPTWQTTLAATATDSTSSIENPVRWTLGNALGMIKHYTDFPRPGHSRTTSCGRHEEVLEEMVG
jgi:hypothetical protein